MKIRLEHLATGKNLHSHLFSSPLSGHQEVSAFGVEGKLRNMDELTYSHATVFVMLDNCCLRRSNERQLINNLLFLVAGEGDTGDNWEVVCSGDAWKRDSAIQFRHIDTSAYLACSGNTFGRPISGQLEVIGLSHVNSACNWQTLEGVFIHPTTESFTKSKPEHNEL